MTKNQLIEYIVENREHSISGYLEHWSCTCSGFKGFVDRHKTKIRSKVKHAKTDEDLDDVRYELEVPYLFLLDKRFEVEYEKYGSSTGRSPDYTVTFDKTTVFNVETGRIREADPTQKVQPDRTSFYGISQPTPYTQNEFRKFSDAICKKLGQMKPGMTNVLVLSSGSTIHEDVDLLWALDSIAQHVSNQNDEFFINKGFQGIKDFSTQFKNLGGVLFRSNWVKVRRPANRNLLWCNDRANQPIPAVISEYLRNMDRQK